MASERILPLKIIIEVYVFTKVFTMKEFTVAILINETRFLEDVTRRDLR